MFKDIYNMKPGNMLPKQIFKKNSSVSFEKEMLYRLKTFFSSLFLPFHMKYLTFKSVNSNLTKKSNQSGESEKKKPSNFHLLAIWWQLTNEQTYETWRKKKVKSNSLKMTTKYRWKENKKKKKSINPFL